MTRAEFHALRDLPGKRITEDIVFRPVMANNPGVGFAAVVVENEHGWDAIFERPF